MFTILSLIYVAWAYDWRVALITFIIIWSETAALNKQFTSLENLMRELAYEPLYKDINTITINQWHSLSVEERTLHDKYWHKIQPGAAWFQCPGCSFPTRRGMYCGHPDCGKKEK